MSANLHNETGQKLLRHRVLRVDSGNCGRISDVSVFCYFPSYCKPGRAILLHSTACVRDGQSVESNLVCVCACVCSRRRSRCVVALVLFSERLRWVCREELGNLLYGASEMSLAALLVYFVAWAMRLVWKIASLSFSYYTTAPEGPTQRYVNVRSGVTPWCSKACIADVILQSLLFSDHWGNCAWLETDCYLSFIVDGWDFLSLSGASSIR